MGRRAADLMAPIPVLGVPASVGVCSWKTIGGAQKWRQCSVGIQTSQVISSPPARTSDTLSVNVTQTFNSCIAKEMEDTLLLTKNDNEKRAILRQKTGETKIRKEVTFKALRVDTSEDDGTYCYARSINTNPIITGTLTSSKIKLKQRYLNGSVVDSEAIGGISIVNDEAEPVKRETFNGRDHHNTGQLAKMRPLYASQSLAVPQEICNNSSEVTNETSLLAENNLDSDAYITDQPLKPSLTSLFTTTHFQVPYNDTQLQQNQQNSLINGAKKITVNPKVLYGNKELRYRKTPHPACPVHSRGNLENPHVASDGTSIQHATILHAVQKEPLAKSLHYSKIPLHRSFTLTPQATTADKPNNPHSHTRSKLFKTPHRKSAVYRTTDNTLTPPHSYVYAVALRSRKAICANTYRTHTTSDNEDKTERETLQSDHKTQISNVIQTPNIVQVAPKGLTVSLSTNPLKSDRTVHPQPDPSEPKEKTHSSSPSAGKMACTDTIVSTAQVPSLTNLPNTTTQHILLSTAVSQSTLNHNANPDQITQTRTKHQPAAVQITSTPPNCLTSKSTLHISASSLHNKSNTSQPPDSKSDFPATYTSETTCPSAPGKNVAFRGIEFCLKKTPHSLLSLLAERQNNVSKMSTSSLQLTDSTKVLSCNEAPDTNKAHHTQATAMKHQGSNELNAWDVFYNQESRSSATPLTSSQPQNVSGNHNNGRNTKLTFSPNVCLDRNKFKHYLINKLVRNESKGRENSNCSNVTNTQNCVPIIKSSSSSFQQGCLHAEQQRLTYCHESSERNCEGRCATSPPVKTVTDSNSHQIPLGATASHANGELESNINRQTHPSVSQPSVTTQTNRGPTNSHVNTQVRCNTSSLACQDSNLLVALKQQTHANPKRSDTLQVSFSCEGELCEDTGPERGSILSTMPLVRPSEVQANGGEDSKCRSQLSTDYTSLAHSHPADAALLLPPSPQCCKSAALEQRLKVVEASLAANKARITTLLNIIHDLETISTPSNR